MNATKHGWPWIKHLVSLLPFLSSLSILPFLFLQFPFLLQFIFLLFLFSPSAYLHSYCLSWCHKFQLHFMSLMPQIKGTFIKIERFKMKPCPSQKKMQEFVGAISHNTSFTHCPLLNLILAWFGWKLVGNWNFSTNLWLTTLFSLF